MADQAVPSADGLRELGCFRRSIKYEIDMFVLTN